MPWRENAPGCLVEEEDSVIILPEYRKNMRVSCRLFVPGSYREHLFHRIAGDSAADQIVKLATVRGIIDPVIGLPDMHAGKDMPVGVCAVFDAEDPECGVPVEAIGGDINCGVRLWNTGLTKGQFMMKREAIMKDIAAEVPIDVRAVHENVCIKSVLAQGIRYLIEKNMAKKEDAERTENGGCIPSPGPPALGQCPRARGAAQLGTLGSGNHYLEFQAVGSIYSPEDSVRLGISQDHVCVAVHCGSRGLGSRACKEFCDEVRRNRTDSKAQNTNSASSFFGPEGPLTVPLHSKEGRKYLKIVSECANYAYCNRVLIGRSIEKVLAKYYPGAQLDVVCDVSHNMAQIEEKNGRSVLVVRKGSSRVSRPGTDTAPGIPVSVGGSMSTGSYLVSSSRSSHLTHYSTCHGSGRILPRKYARQEISLDATLQQLQRSDVHVVAKSSRTLPEESESAYKDIDCILEFCERTGISRRICRFSPLAVLKG